MSDQPDEPPTSEESLASIAESLKQIAGSKSPSPVEMKTTLSATGSGSATLTITKPEPAEVEDDGFTFGDLPSGLRLVPGDAHEFCIPPGGAKFLVVFGDYGNISVDVPPGQRVTVAAGTVPAQIIVAKPSPAPDSGAIPRIDDHR